MKIENQIPSDILFFQREIYDAHAIAHAIKDLLEGKTKREVFALASHPNSEVTKAGEPGKIYAKLGYLMEEIDGRKVIRYHDGGSVIASDDELALDPVHLVSIVASHLQKQSVRLSPDPNQALCIFRITPEALEETAKADHL